jgi:transaldolase
VRQACDVLRPVYDATGGLDGRVSIEVHPRIAHDTQRTLAEARALWWLVDRPNMFVKIPAAKQGIPAITACLAEGVSINVTLIFSLTRYCEVIGAFLAGLEQARAAGRDLPGIASVASFFVSRVDTEVDKRLDKAGTPQAAALRARPLSPTHGSPTNVMSSRPPPAGGRRLRERGPGRSARCGPPPASRIPLTTTPGMSPAWSPETS